MSSIFENWQKVLLGMVTVTILLSFLAVVLAPYAGATISDDVRTLVFSLLGALLGAVGVYPAAKRQGQVELLREMGPPNDAA